MLLFILALLSGFIGLVYSADKFVSGSVGLAKLLKISPLVIGLTIVALGTSAPEIFVSAIAALNGSPQLAIGNALGSNITNIGLVLGCTAIAVALPLCQNVIKTQLPIFIIIAFLAGLLLWDLTLSRAEGFILVGSLIAYLYFTVKNASDDEITLPSTELTVTKSWLLLIGGIIGLVIFSQALVWGAKGLAREFGVSELVIGLTAVAIGTSLPELAITFMSALKGQRDIAIGNIIGSNIFNLLGVMGIAGIIQPTVLDSAVITRDYPMTLLLSLLLCAVFIPKIWNRQASLQINRLLGALFLALYIAYFYFLL